MFVRRVIGLFLVSSSLDPFLCIGITLASFKLFGKIPVEKVRLIILERETDISPFRVDIILDGILKGPEDLPRFRDDIQPITSMESVGKKNLVKKDEPCLESKGMFFLILSAIDTK